MALPPGADTASPLALTISFMALALGQAFHLGNAGSEEHVLNMRQAVSNPLALGAVGFVVLLQVLAVHFRPLAEVLRTESLGTRDWLVCVSLSLLPAVIGQFGRWVSTKRARASSGRSLDS